MESNGIYGGLPVICWWFNGDLMVIFHGIYGGFNGI